MRAPEGFRCDAFLRRFRVETDALHCRLVVKNNQFQIQSVSRELQGKIKDPNALNVLLNKPIPKIMPILQKMLGYSGTGNSWKTLFRVQVESEMYRMDRFLRAQGWTVAGSNRRRAASPTPAPPPVLLSPVPAPVPVTAPMPAPVSLPPPMPAPSLPPPMPAPVSLPPLPPPMPAPVSLPAEDSVADSKTRKAALFFQFHLVSNVFLTASDKASINAETQGWDVCEALCNGSG
jgi:hypothetical protein